MNSIGNFQSELTQVLSEASKVRENPPINFKTILNCSAVGAHVILNSDEERPLRISKYALGRSFFMALGEGNSWSLRKLIRRF